MPDNSSLTPADNSRIVSNISFSVYKTILDVQQQQPELLREKYRNVRWHDPRNQTIFLERLQEKLGKTADRETLMIAAKNFLGVVLAPEFFQSFLFEELLKKIYKLTDPENQVNNSSISTNRQLANTEIAAESLVPIQVGEVYGQEIGISILLLDAENLQLNIEIEKFIAGICKYPIQIKIAFANWRSMGKQDLELHERGYELIHVPAGKDSADVKMATVGSSIFVHYPTAKEVLVCSSDRVMTHLCTTLQTHGLTVYLIRKQTDNIEVINSKTGNTQIYCLKPTPEIPSIENFIAQLKKLIKAEQVQNHQHWVKLSKISSLFKTLYNLNISQIVSIYFPGKRARDIFIDYPADFAIHQPSGESELYVTLFENNDQQIEENQVNLPEINNTLPQKVYSNISDIDSQGSLVQVLIKILQELAAKSNGKPVHISTLDGEFKKIYGYQISAIIKTLKLSSRYITFLQSCNAFKLKQLPQGWHIEVSKISKVS